MIEYICPKCGNTLEHIEICTFPPQERWNCPKCGYITEKTKELRKVCNSWEKVIANSTLTIRQEVEEDTENFIFTTIKSWCEDKVQRTISKRELEEALIQYKGWIPCSVRPAEAPCLATDKYHNQPYVANAILKVTCNDDSVKCFDAEGFHFGVDGSGRTLEREIIAWMPLPRAYGESEDI